ncbi:MAG: cellulase family glycosylhydrolase [Chloroflexi bacterium]|nr:cellulase family glycosylhydrolase [Chloroflexota bacterium]
MQFSRRLPLRLISFLLLVGSLVGLALAPKPAQPPPVTSAAPRPIPHTDVNPLGANFFLEREVEAWKREQTLKLAREAGIGWIKQMFVWEEIEPRKGYYYDDKFKKSTWEKYDEIVALAERHGMRIIARLDRPPAWTRRDNRYVTAPPDDFADYASFVRTVVSRYKGRVQYYQVWNEPNIWPEWGDRPVDPAGYVTMLKLAAAAAREADPGVVILSAPLAETLEESPRNLSELQYLDAMYRAGARDAFDVLTVNAYGFEFPPDAPPDPRTLNFQRVKLLRNVMERHGDGQKAVWFNEFGWNASPPEFSPAKLIWRRVPEQQQADYTAQAIRLARSWGWVGVINLWYFRQVGDIPIEQSDYFFRVVDTDFTPRLVYHRVKELGQELQVAGAGDYEATNPAVQLQGAWSGQRVEGAPGQRAWRSPEQGGAATFTVAGTSLALMVLTGKEPTRLSMTVDGKEGGLPLQGPRAGPVLELPGTATPALVKTMVATGLSPGVHAVRLERLSGPPWAFTTFEVEYKPDTTAFWALALAAALGGAGLVLSSLRRRGASGPG